MAGWQRSFLLYFPFFLKSMPSFVAKNCMCGSNLRACSHLLQKFETEILFHTSEWGCFCLMCMDSCRKSTTREHFIFIVKNSVRAETLPSCIVHTDHAARNVCLVAAASQRNVNRLIQSPREKIQSNELGKKRGNGQESGEKLDAFINVHHLNFAQKNCTITSLRQAVYKYRKTQPCNSADYHLIIF